MGLRFQRVLRIIPGVRINLSKSGVSGSVGPRGASVNIGRHGVTTSAGLPGTGLSYRQRLGHPGTLLGVVLLIAALAFAAWRSGTFNSALPPQIQHATTSTAGSRIESAATASSGIRYVSRNNAVLHATPSPHGTTLKHESKGTPLTIIATSGDWIEVRDSDTTTGWMKAGTLRDTQPK